jgi:hypothetical protein
MTAEELERLPGSEIVLAGIADLRAGRQSVEASAVQSASVRLRRLGLEAPALDGFVPASHQLYFRLRDDLGDGAHSRQKAILARVASFARAAESARAR